MCTISRVRAANERGQRLEKPGNSLGGHTMATAPFGRARSVASCQCLGHVTRWGYSDSRRSRKNCARFGRQHDGDCAFWWGAVGGLLPCPGHHYALGVFGQSPLPEKIRTILEAARWRLRLLVGRVSSFVPVPRTHLRVGRIRTVAATGKDPHDLDNTGRSVNVLPETRKTLIIRPRKSTLRLPGNGMGRNGLTDSWLANRSRPNPTPIFQRH